MMEYMRKVGEVFPNSFLVSPEMLCSTPDHVLEQRLRGIQRELWVRKQYEKTRSLRLHGKATVAINGSYTFVAITLDLTPHMGWAKCSPLDDRDDRVGIAVATARAYGEQIPDYI